MNGTGMWFASLDRLRRAQGDTLERFGLGAQESPYQIISSWNGLRLRCYAAGCKDAPPLLIVPAPIKRPYIWDISPARSVVQAAIERGFGVYLAEWAEAGDEAPGGLAHMAGTLLDTCVAAALAHCGASQVFLAGHSLGGILGALYSAYRPARVAALVLVDTPLQFDGECGAFRKLLDLDVDASAVLPASAHIPGSLLSMMSVSAAPRVFCTDRYLDYLASMASPELMKTHWRVERWTMDEWPMPRALFEDVVERLYRRDQFMRGELRFGETPVRPRQLTAPLLSVVETAAGMHPSDAARALHAAVGSADTVTIAYPGDIGVALQHVGPLVGDNAHREVWPRVFDWLDGHAASARQ